MKLLNHKIGRYIVLLPVLLLLVNCVYAHWLTDAIPAALLAEKLTEKRLDIDLICAQIDDYVERDNDWDTYDYSAALRRSMAYLDEQPLTYAAMFDEDMRDLSQRSESYAGSPFTPMLDLSFVDAVCANESGDYVMPFTPLGEKTRDMHIYYRWVPSDRALTGQYLLVVAISSYSIVTPLAEWYTIGALSNIVITFVVVSALVFLLVRAGTLYASREIKSTGRWRGETRDT